MVGNFPLMMRYFFCLAGRIRMDAPQQLRKKLLRVFAYLSFSTHQSDAEMSGKIFFSEPTYPIYPG
jgi:hypothetical protein